MLRCLPLVAPFLALALLLPAATGLVAGPAAPADPDVLPDQLLVTFAPGEQASIAGRVAALGGQATFFEHIPGTAVVLAGEGRGPWMGQELRRSAGVESVTPDGVTRVAFTPNDPRFTSQYGPQQIRAREAWDITTGHHGVKVAVMDTGIDFAHEDLVGNLCGSATFVPGTSTAADDFGHGTHVAGIVAAGLNNGKGIAGMSNSCILAVKVLDTNGVGSWGWLVSGINWAIGQGAKVITMSLSGPGNPGPSVENAVNAAWNAGIFLDGSAGNAGCPQLLYGNVAGVAGFSSGWPGAYSKVMSVAATDPGEVWAFYSSCGPQLDIGAPGTNVLSTLPPCGGGMEICSSTLYGSISGTSMAAPHVAGVAALMFAARPGITPKEVFCFIIFTAEQVNFVPWDPLLGFGEIDAERAVKRARDGPPIGQGVNQFGQLEVNVCNQATAPVTGVSNIL